MSGYICPVCRLLCSPLDEHRCTGPAPEGFNAATPPMTSDLDALAAWEAAQNHLERCNLRTGQAPNPVECNCGYVHRMEVSGCKLADAIKALHEIVNNATVNGMHDTKRMDKAERLLAAGRDIVGAEVVVRDPIHAIPTLRAALDAWKEPTSV